MHQKQIKRHAHCAWTETAPTTSVSVTIKKNKNKSRNYVDFIGFDTRNKYSIDYLRVSPKEFTRCIKYMDNKDDIVIRKSKIKMSFDFEFDNGPFVETLRSETGSFSRVALAHKIYEKYSELFNDKTRRRWVKDIKTIAVKQVYRNNDGKYELDVDIN